MKNVVLNIFKCVSILYISSKYLSFSTDSTFWFPETRPCVIIPCSRCTLVALGHLTFRVVLSSARGEAHSLILSEGTG